MSVNCKLFLEINLIKFNFYRRKDLYQSPIFHWGGGGGLKYIYPNAIFVTEYYISHVIII